MADLRIAAQQALEALAAMTTARCGGDDGMDISPINAAYDKAESAITALRAALAQQAEPVEPVAWSGYDLDGMVEAFSRVIEARYQRANPFQNPIDMDAQMALRILRGFIPAMKAYTAPPQQAEPVAPVGRVVSANCEYATVQWLKQTSDVGGGDPKNSRSWPIAGDAVYTAPSQRKPLTDEKISDLWCEVSNTDFVTADTHVFARAVERAHGIKE